MKKETFTRSEILEVIERMKQREREYCDEFCAQNSGEAVDERRRVASVILGTLNSVLYSLDMMNDSTAAAFAAFFLRRKEQSCAERRRENRMKY